MTIEYAIRLAEQWANGDVCSLRDGEAESYHRLCLEALREKRKREFRQWISVKDRLPEEDYTFVLVLVETWKRTVGVALYAEHGFYNPLAADVQMNVTHWMPLPEPPEEE